MTCSPADTVKHTPLACCPFCGGEATYRRDHTTERVDTVACHACGFWLSDLGEKQGDCIAAWNRRAPDPVREKLVEALETKRDYIADAASGALTYEDSGEGFKAMALEDLARIDAALLLAKGEKA